MNHLSFQIPPFPTFIKGGEAIFSKGKKHIRRNYSVFDLLYVKKGTLSITEGEKQFEINEGEYLILVPGVEHFGHKGCMEETNYIWLHFLVHGAYKSEYRTNLKWKNILEKEGTFEEPTQFMFYIPQYNSFQQRDMMEQNLMKVIQIGNDQTPDYHLRQQIMFQDFMLQLQKQAMQIPTAAEQVCEEVLIYIRGNYNKAFNMTLMSKQLHLHPDYITRCVQKTIGISPTHYLFQYRISQAKSLLSKSNVKISSICKEVGMEDQGYFSKVFRKFEGISPMEYRRIVQRS